MIETQYTLEFADLKAGQRLRVWSSLSTLFRYSLVVWVLPLFVIAIDLRFLWSMSQSHRFRGEAAFGLMFLFLTILIMRMALRFGRVPHKMSKTVAGKVIKFRFDQETFGMEIPGEAEVGLHWEMIKGYQEDKKVALLLLGEEKVFTVPRRAFNEAQWEELRSIVAEKTKAKTLVA
jgi:uncharacterized membrane protein YjdF